MYYQKLCELNKIYGRLQDDVSKVVFDARLGLLLGQLNRETFFDKISCNREWKLNNIEDEEIVIFGSGVGGRHFKQVFELCGKKIVAVVDNHANIGGNWFDIPLINPQKYVESYYNVRIVLSSANYEKEMKNQLINLGVCEDNIIKEAAVCAFTGRQYFDVFSPKRDESFIDCGAYNMETTLDFISWNRDYRNVYAFEPDAKSYKKCVDRLKDKNERISICNSAAYYYEGKIGFSNDGSGGSSIAQEAAFICDTQTIDNVLKNKDERKLYIKMDVEGSEKESLQGAEQTIKKYKPRLAICVYHKPMDIIDLPLYILELNPDYQKFWFRHYASNYCETVLYAE